MKSEVGLMTSPSCQHTLSSARFGSHCAAVVGDEVVAGTAARFGPRCAAMVGDEVVDGTEPAGAAPVLGLFDDGYEQSCEPLNQLPDSSEDVSTSLSQSC